MIIPVWPVVLYLDWAFDWILCAVARALALLKPRLSVLRARDTDRE